MRASKLASAYVEVNPDLSGFGAQAKAGVDAATKDLKATAKIQLDIADATAKAAQIQARMDRLNAIIARPEVTPQMQKAYTELDELQAELERLNGETVTPKVEAQITDTQAKIDEVNAKLDELQARDTEVRVKASADLMAAEAQLDRVNAKLDELGDRDVSPRVGLDDSEFNRKIDEDKAKLAELGNSSASPGLGFPGGGLGMGITGGILGGGALLPALPGALAGGTAAAGTLGLAIAGVSKALSDYSSQQGKAATATGQSASSQLSAAHTITSAQQAVSQAETQAQHDAITSAEAIKTAQQGVQQAVTQAAHDQITSAESIRNAQQGVAQATQQAAQSQISAEEQLANAQYSEQQAQESLTQARQQAILTLQQLENASADAALNVQQDQLNVQQAEVTQQQVDASSKSTALQRAQAALAVKEAEQQLKEAIEARTNSSKAAQTADKEGVAGNPAVLAAEHQVQQSKQAVADAQRNLANVEKAGAQAIAKAEQSLADAIRSASWQRVADAQNVAKAQQSLADTSRSASWQQQADAKNVANAQANLKYAYASAGTAAGNSGKAASAYSQDLKKLTPAGKSFVTAITGMMGALHSLEGVSEKALMPGLTAFLGGLKSIGPEVSKEVADMGGILSKGFEAIGRTLKSSGFQKELQTLFDEGNKFMSVLGPALGTITSDFLQMGAEAAPAVQGLASGLSAILDGVGQLFLNLGKYAGAAGSILNTLGQAVGALGGPLGTVIGVINSALAPLLAGMLPAFKAILGQIADVVKSAQPGLTAIGQALGQMFRQLTPLAQPLGNLISALIKLAAAAIEPLLSSGMLPKLIGTFTQLATSVLPPVTKLISDLTPVIGFLSKATVAFINVALTPLEGAWEAVARVMGPISHAIDVIGSAISRITGPISGFLGTFSGIVGKLTGGNAQDASKGADAISGSIQGLGSNAGTASGLISGLNDSFTTMVGNFTGKQQAVMDTASAIQSYGQDVSTAGAGSEQAQQGFLDSVNAIGQMATALQQAHTPNAVIYQDIQNQITALQNKGPLNKTETSDLQNLKTWADHFADSSQHLGFEQQSVANTMKNQFIPQLVSLGLKSGTAKTDTDNLTNAIVNTGKQSDATKGARAKLIADLEQSGVNANTAKGKVDNYIKSLGKIPAKDATSILLSGKGEWSIKESNIYPTPSGKAPTPPIGQLAAGGLVPGYGGGDRWPALLEGGEAIVPKHLTPMVAPLLKAYGVPGFAEGGFAGGTSGLAKYAGKQYDSTWSSMVTTMQKDMTGAAKAAIAGAAGSGGSGGGRLHLTGSGATVEALMKSMAASVGWTGAQWGDLYNVEMREAGFNLNATNPSSGAYGLAQFINGPSEYAQYGGNSTTARGQITGMLNYIKQRYGTPANAWSHELNYGWYDQGGMLQPGVTMAANNTGQPEMILPPSVGNALTGSTGPLAKLNQTLVAPGGPVITLTKTLANPGGPMAYLQRTIANPGGPMAKLSKSVADPGGPMAKLGTTAADPGGPIAQVGKGVATGGAVDSLAKALDKADAPMSDLARALTAYVAAHPGKGGGGGGSGGGGGGGTGHGGGGSPGPHKLPGGRLPGGDHPGHGGKPGGGPPPRTSPHPGGHGTNPGGPVTINVNYNGRKPSPEDHQAAMLQLAAAIGVA